MKVSQEKKQEVSEQSKAKPAQLAQPAKGNEKKTPFVGPTKKCWAIPAEMHRLGRDCVLWIELTESFEIFDGHTIVVKDLVGSNTKGTKKSGIKSDGGTTNEERVYRLSRAAVIAAAAAAVI